MSETSTTLRAAIAACDVVMRRLDRAPQLAEKVELPSGIEADEIGDLREAGAVLRPRRASARRGRAPDRCRCPRRRLQCPRTPAAPRRRRRPPARALPADGSRRFPASGSPATARSTSEFELAVVQRAPPVGGIDRAAASRRLSGRARTAPRSLPASACQAGDSPARPRTRPGRSRPAAPSRNERIRAKPALSASILPTRELGWRRRRTHADPTTATKMTAEPQRDDRQKASSSAR